MLLAECRRRKGESPYDGPQIMDWVIHQALIRVVPMAMPWLCPFIAGQRLRTLAHSLLNKATDWIDDGHHNGSHQPIVVPSPADEVATALKGPPDDGPGRAGIK